MNCSVEYNNLKHFGIGVDSLWLYKKYPSRRCYYISLSKKYTGACNLTVDMLCRSREWACQHNDVHPLFSLQLLLRSV